MPYTCKDCGEPIEQWQNSPEEFQGQPPDAWHHITLTEAVRECNDTRPQMEVIPA